jgi:hypothetical protein
MHLSDVVWAAVLSSGITSVALLVQMLLSNKREDRRLAFESQERLSDREQVRKIAEAERREALRDHWRDERLTAHTELIAVFSAIHARLLGGELPPPEVVQELSEAMARADLLGSSESAGQARKMYQAWTRARDVLREAKRSRRSESEIESLMKQPLDDLMKERKLYRGTARRDLDTES